MDSASQSSQQQVRSTSGDLAFALEEAVETADEDFLLSKGDLTIDNIHKLDTSPGPSLPTQQQQAAAAGVNVGTSDGGASPPVAPLPRPAGAADKGKRPAAGAGAAPSPRPRPGGPRSPAPGQPSPGGRSKVPRVAMVQTASTSAKKVSLAGGAPSPTTGAARPAGTWGAGPGQRAPKKELPMHKTGERRDAAASGVTSAGVVAGAGKYGVRMPAKKGSAGGATPWWGDTLGRSTAMDRSNIPKGQLAANLQRNIMTPELKTNASPTNIPKPMLRPLAPGQAKKPGQLGRVKTPTAHDLQGIMNEVRELKKGLCMVPLEPGNLPPPEPEPEPEPEAASPTGEDGGEDGGADAAAAAGGEEVVPDEEGAKAKEEEEEEDKKDDEPPPPPPADPKKGPCCCCCCSVM